MEECKGCGAPVSDDFARVFGTNQGTVHACPECAAMSEIIEGGALRP